jgi:CRISPR-associated protein Csd2
MTALTQRHEFVILFEVINGNPNGDPDAGNLPRLDPETNRGLVTDVSLKRKIRNYVSMAKGDEAPETDAGLDTIGKRFEIFVTERAILDQKQRRAWKATAVKPNPNAKPDKPYALLPKEDIEARKLSDWMCANFYDVRTFGAVMSTSGGNCGQVRGPVQIAFGQSEDAIVPQEITITRMAATKEDDTKDDNRTMGRKHIVPYALYRAHGFVSAKLAERTGFDEADLELLFQALEQMFDHDRSAARGEMATRKLIIFRHACALGNAPAHALFDRVKVGRNVAGELRDPRDPSLANLQPSRSYQDYMVEIDRSNLPDGIEIIERI